MTKTSKLKKALEFERGLSEVKMNQAFFNALRRNEWVNADTVYDEALKLEIPPKEVARLLAPLFKVYRKAGLIVKGKNFALSNRSSRPLPWYQSKKFDGKPKSLASVHKEALVTSPKSNFPTDKSGNFVREF